MGLPVLRSISFYTHAVTNTPAGPVGAFALLPHRRRPSLNDRQVGTRITCFEACSVFTHVTACAFAESQNDPFTSEALATSSPPSPLRLLLTGAIVVRRDSHPLKIGAFHGALSNQG